MPSSTSCGTVRGGGGGGDVSRYETRGAGGVCAASTLSCLPAFSMPPRNRKGVISLGGM